MPRVCVLLVAVVLAFPASSIAQPQYYGGYLVQVQATQRQLSTASPIPRVNLVTVPQPPIRLQQPPLQLPVMPRTLVRTIDFWSASLKLNAGLVADLQFLKHVALGVNVATAYYRHQSERPPLWRSPLLNLGLVTIVEHARVSRFGLFGGNAVSASPHVVRFLVANGPADRWEHGSHAVGVFAAGVAGFGIAGPPGAGIARAIYKQSATLAELTFGTHLLEVSTAANLFDRYHAERIVWTATQAYYGQRPFQPSEFYAGDSVTGNPAWLRDLRNIPVVLPRAPRVAPQVPAAAPLPMITLAPRTAPPVMYSMPGTWRAPSTFNGLAPLRPVSPGLANVLRPLVTPGLDLTRLLPRINSSQWLQPYRTSPFTNWNWSNQYRQPTPIRIYIPPPIPTPRP